MQSTVMPRRVQAHHNRLSLQKKAALWYTRQLLATANARDELTADKYCISMVDECVAMPEVQELHNSVKTVGTRAEDAIEHASYAHHLGLISDPAE
jgi:hypothetical protein